MVRIWKGPLKWIGNFAMAAGIIGVAAHYMRFGPKEVEDRNHREGRCEVSAAAVPHTPHAGELERYTFTERIMHWITGLTYLYCLGDRACVLLAASLLARVHAGRRARHRASGIPSSASAFVIGTLWMNSLWRRDMEITEVDKRWLDHTRSLHHQRRRAIRRCPIASTADKNFSIG